MASPPPQQRELVFDGGDLFPIRIYGDGTCDRLGLASALLPASVDPSTGVASKDVDLHPNVSARLYLPTLLQEPSSRLPLLLYFHGGAFCIETPFSPLYHPYLTALSSTANVLAVSVHYRRVPEHPLPACYDDAWEALRWVASHLGKDGPEAWLNEHADLSRVFLAGDSAGANVAHHLAMQKGKKDPKEGSEDVKVEGVVLVHPYFWGRERIAREEGLADAKIASFVDGLCALFGEGHERWMDPVKEGGLEGLGCERVMVCVAERDVLRGRGWEYYEALRASGWRGKAEIWEAPGESHVFHLHGPSGENAKAMMERVAAFFASSP